MIDYEITVDVSNADVETKKRVQDAYFKLGFVWFNGPKGTKHNFLDKECYTNTFRQGLAPRGFLMWAGVPREPTHTVDELLELAGMKTDTKFDLEKTLAGEPVILRNGLKAYVRYRETELESAPLLGFFIRDGSLGIGAWEECGKNYWNRRTGESDYDIIGMWNKPLEFKHWDLLLEDIKYIAKDVHGQWYGYFKKPSRDGIEWFVRPHRSYADYYPLKALHPKLFPECSWENSLIERPENV